MTLTSQNLTAVSKLLLNAWSAEYALRIKPVSADQDYLKNSLNWVFPQVVDLLKNNGQKTSDGQSVLGGLGLLPNWDALIPAINRLALLGS